MLDWFAVDISARRYAQISQNKEPYILSKEPYILSKEPCILFKEPYIP